MAISTPILESIYPFDANDTYDFIFRYDKGGTQYNKHNLVIETNRGDGTDSVVYDVILDSFDPFHTYIPGSATIPLINGKQYKAKIRLGANISWSEFSEWKIFYVHTKPIINIVNIGDDGFIYNYIDTFQAIYSIPAGEDDPLISYQYTLYDENLNIINQYDKKYITDANPNIEQVVTNLEYNKQYNIKLHTESLHGVVVNLIEPFRAIYEFPIMGDTTFVLENVPQKPSVQISFYVKQIDGEGEDNIHYEDNTWVNLIDNTISYEKDFLVEKDFVAKIWCKDLVNNKTLFKIQGADGVIELIYFHKRIHVFKYRNNSPKYHIVSDILINPIEYTFILLKQQNNRLNLVCQQT